MTTAQVVETSVTVNNNSPIQDYVHPDDQTQPFEMTPGFKPLIIKIYIYKYLIFIFLIRFIYSIHIIQVFSFVCVLTWSLLGVTKSLGHAQIGLL